MRPRQRTCRVHTLVQRDNLAADSVPAAVARTPASHPAGLCECVSAPCSSESGAWAGRTCGQAQAGEKTHTAASGGHDGTRASGRVWSLSRRPPPPCPPTAPARDSTGWRAHAGMRSARGGKIPGRQQRHTHLVADVWVGHRLLQRVGRHVDADTVAQTDWGENMHAGRRSVGGGDRWALNALSTQ